MKKEIIQGKAEQREVSINPSRKGQKVEVLIFLIGPSLGLLDCNTKCSLNNQSKIRRTFSSKLWH